MVVNDAVNEQRAMLNHKVEKKKTTKQMKNSVSRCNYNKHITLKLIDIANTRVAIYQLLIQTNSDYSIAKFKKLRKKKSPQRSSKTPHKQFSFYSFAIIKFIIMRVVFYVC